MCERDGTGEEISIALSLIERNWKGKRNYSAGLPRNNGPNVKSYDCRAGWEEGKRLAILLLTGKREEEKVRSSLPDQQFNQTIREREGE